MLLVVRGGLYHVRHGPGEVRAEERGGQMRAC